MKKFIYYITELILIIVIFGCDPAISYDFSIQNNSDREFQVGFMSSGLNFRRPDNDSIVTIFSNSHNIIAHINVWGSRPHDEGTNFLNVFDTIYYVNNDSLIITKNLTVRGNWTYDNDIDYLGLIKTGTNYYTMTIENADFQKINER